MIISGALQSCWTAASFLADEGSDERVTVSPSRELFAKRGIAGALWLRLSGLSETPVPLFLKATTPAEPSAGVAGSLLGLAEGAEAFCEP